MFKKILALLALIGALSLIGKGWYSAKEGFHIARLRAVSTPIVEAKGDWKRLHPICSQPFSYLGRGRQCYAFQSEDEKYVLKLPRLDLYELPLWLKVCAFPFLDTYRNSRLADKARRRDFLVQSFQIASEELPIQTATLYYHGNQTADLNTVVTLKDRVGRSYQIDLDRTFFLLQEKKPTMVPPFLAALQRGDRPAAKEILSAFLAVISSRSRKGIFNKDCSFETNFAFDGEACFEIDAGSFYRKNGLSKEEAFAISLKEMALAATSWIAEKDPELGRWFVNEIEQLLKEERF